MDRGRAEDGALLVRPDKIVAWRSLTMVDNPEAVLTALVFALRALL